MCTMVGGQSRWWNCVNACLSKLINTPELTNISVIICIYFRWENIFEQARWLKARFKTICSVIAGVTTYTLYRAGHATIFWLCDNDNTTTWKRNRDSLTRKNLNTWSCCRGSACCRVPSSVVQDGERKCQRFIRRIFKTSINNNDKWVFKPAWTPTNKGRH